MVCLWTSPAITASLAQRTPDGGARGRGSVKPEPASLSEPEIVECPVVSQGAERQVSRLDYIRYRLGPVRAPDPDQTTFAVRASQSPEPATPMLTTATIVATIASLAMPHTAAARQASTSDACLGNASATYLVTVAPHVTPDAGWPGPMRGDVLVLPDDLPDPLLIGDYPGMEQEWPTEFGIADLLVMQFIGCGVVTVDEATKQALVEPPTGEPATCWHPKGAVACQPDIRADAATTSAESEILPESGLTANLSGLASLLLGVGAVLWTLARRTRAWS
jgi:hypothetical protein